jgi:hypothetical protein
MAEPDQTNAEVSDERLLTDLEALLNEIDDGGYMLKREWTPEMREKVWAFADRFEERRSVTTQASEGALTDKELWEAGCLTRHQVEKWTNADLAAHPDGVRKTLKFLFALYAAPQSKRVERLEAEREWHKIADGQVPAAVTLWVSRFADDVGEWVVGVSESYMIGKEPASVPKWTHWQYLGPMPDQALQGDRS